MDWGHASVTRVVDVVGVEDGAQEGTNGVKTMTCLRGTLVSEV